MRGKKAGQVKIGTFKRFGKRYNRYGGFCECGREATTVFGSSPVCQRCKQIDAEMTAYHKPTCGFALSIPDSLFDKPKRQHAH